MSRPLSEAAGAAPAVHAPLPQVTSADLQTDDGGYRPLDMTRPGPGSYRDIALPGREFAYDEVGRSLDFERFMGESIDINIVEPTDDAAPPAVYVGVNGDAKWLPRGIPIRIQRYFVERLAASVESWYSQEEDRDPNSDTGMKTKVRKRACYPIQILRDPSPQLGRAWLARVVREGC